MFDVNILLENNKILGKFIADGYFFVSSKYEYAFYLCLDAKKIKKQNYSSKMDVIFDLEDISGEVYIRVFVKDIEYGDIRKFNSKKITLDT